MTNDAINKLSTDTLWTRAHAALIASDMPSAWALCDVLCQRRDGRDMLSTAYPCLLSKPRMTQGLLDRIEQYNAHC
jgi:hypothetical protein